MAGLRIFRVLGLVAGLLFVSPGISKGAISAISLRVNGEDVNSVTLQPGQWCSIEIVSNDNSEYAAFVGFQDAYPLGTFVHTETRPQAGTLAMVNQFNEPPFSFAYEVLALGGPSPGVHFVFQYVASTPGQVELGLWNFTIHKVDEVLIMVEPPPHEYGACCNQGTGECFYTEQWDCPYTWLGPGTDCSLCQSGGFCCEPDGSCYPASPGGCPGEWVPDCSMCQPHQEFGACCNELTGDCYISEIWGCIYNWLGPGTDCSMCVAPPQEIKVEIHTVKGSGITEAQIRGWIDKANQSDYPNVKFVVDSNHVYEPNTPYDPNKNEKCKVNIWGVKKNFWADRWPGIIDPNVSAQLDKVICLVPGDGNNIYIKDSTLAHELNHIFLGPEHSNDPNNKMCPDNDWHAGVLKSCHRKGTKLTSDQQKKIKEKAEKSGKASDAVIGRYGDEKYDNVGDVSFEYIDLAWMQGWIEWIQNVYLLHLTAQVRMLSFENYSEVGFYIESDNCLSTGQPPEGLDYYLAFQPQSHQIIFEIYDTDWMPLDSEGISFEFTYANPDVNLPPIPTGVKFELPLPLLQRRAGDVISYRAAAQNNVQMDVSPNVGLLSIELHPKPVPGDLNLDGKVDYDDLKIMTEIWLKTGCSVADIYPALNVDNIVDFKDLAVLSTNWLEGPP